MNESTLLPIEQRIVEFEGSEIVAVLVDANGRHEIYVPIRPLTDALGLAWSGQYERIRRDPILSDIVITVRIIRDQDQAREYLCLPLSHVNGWLFGVQANRVKEAIRPRLLAFQRNCYQVLASAFETTSLVVAPTQEHQALIQVRELALAIAEMAQQQIAMTTRLDKAAIVVGEHGRRITVLEQQLAPRQAITDEQASDIAEAVKALALFMGEKDQSKNHFQSIFAELYRRFRVSSYKTIRQSQYHFVMDFLNEWDESLKGAANS